jgi:hypothetical protein
MKSVTDPFVSIYGSHNPNIMDDFYVVFKSQNQIPVHMHKGRKGKEKAVSNKCSPQSRLRMGFPRSAEHHDVYITIFRSPRFDNMTLAYHEGFVLCFRYPGA